MKKVLSVLVVLLCVLSLVSCLDVTDIKSLEFSKAPEGVYVVGNPDKLPIASKDFEVTAGLSDGTFETIALDSNELTVQGLVNDKLDVETVGNKVLKVTYKGLTITFNYLVKEGAVVSQGKWIEYTAEPTVKPDEEGYKVYEVANAQQLAHFAKLSETLKEQKTKIVLTNNIDLQEHEWVPISINDVK